MRCKSINFFEIISFFEIFQVFFTAIKFKKMDNIKLNRRELYDLVWSTPMTALAKKYLISDSGLRKICVKMEIPLPKAGHWEKLKAGKNVEIIKLPAGYKGNNEIELALRVEGDESIKGTRSPEIALKEEIENDPLLNIIVPDILTKPHNLIAETKKHILTMKTAIAKTSQVI